MPSDLTVIRANLDDERPERGDALITDVRRERLQVEVDDGALRRVTIRRHLECSLKDV